MYGKGLLIGLGITMRHFVRNFFGGAITEQYPERRPVLPARFHGALSLEPAKCTACSTCANLCPNGVIKIASIRDEETKKRRLTGYKVNLLYCLFCGICVESCPENALHFSHEFELATWSREGAVLDLYARGRKQDEAEDSAAGEAVGG